MAQKLRGALSGTVYRHKQLYFIEACNSGHMATMSKKHDKVLSSITGNHVSGNIHWKEVESLLHHLGADLREGGGARVIVTLNGVEATLHRPHHGATMNKTSLHQLQQFLSAAGIPDLH